MQRCRILPHCGSVQFPELTLGAKILFTPKFQFRSNKLLPIIENDHNIFYPSVKSPDNLNRTGSTIEPIENNQTRLKFDRPFVKEDTLLDI